MTHRRDFIRSMAAYLGAVGAGLLSSRCARFSSTVGYDADIPEPRWGSNASDPGIVMREIAFDSDGDPVAAFLARPQRAGPHPAVIVIHANSVYEPYIADTAALLARAGFVALAVDVFHFYPNVHSWDEARNVPGSTVNATMQREFREPRLVRDVQEGIDFLRSQPDVARNGVGLIGFCGGGWNALLVAAQSMDVGAVVAFYAPVNISDVQHRAPQELTSFIAAPVQYHQPGRDEYVPAEDVTRFERTLRDAGRVFDRFVYPDAQHGFFAFNREAVFRASDAALAWTRLVPFLRSHLSVPAPAHVLAPTRTSRRNPLDTPTHSLHVGFH